MSLFSIVIPTYNGEKTIGLLLKSLSLVSDNYTKELIILDSNSSDNTLKIVSKYKKFFSRIKTIHIYKKNFNHGITRNLAVKKAKGKYICFFSQDTCLINREMFNVLLKNFQKYHKVAVVFGPHIPYKSSPLIQQLEVICRWERFKTLTNKEGVWIQNKNMKSVPLVKKTETLWYALSNTASCYQRSFLLKYHFTKAEYGEDMILGKKIIYLGYTKIFDIKCAVKHSHNYNFWDYYLREKQDLKLRFQILKLKEKPLILCKFKKIFKLKINIFKKAMHILELIFYYFLKLLILFEMKLFSNTK
jgi:glycosyltransferase involved in cell wall biosynthesis